MMMTFLSYDLFYIPHMHYLCSVLQNIKIYYSLFIAGSYCWLICQHALSCHRIIACADFDYHAAEACMAVSPRHQK